MSLLSSLTPLALGAFDLYRRRREAHLAEAAERDERDLVRMTESLQRRVHELEASDLELARITSGLAESVRGLATSLERSVAEGNRSVARWQRLTWIALIVAGTSLLLTIWALAR